MEPKNPAGNESIGKKECFMEPTIARVSPR